MATDKYFCRWGLGSFQLISMALGLLFGGWLLVVAARDYFWANQPVIKAFYSHDVLIDPHDENGMFRADAFDQFQGKALSRAQEQLQAAGLSCEPVNPQKSTTSCHYGYETQTGCCRFRVELHFDAERQVTKVLGDKTGRCPR